nr:ribonuclease H-like domain-containing protein [Tanacetum cinerariifolium]
SNNENNVEYVIRKGEKDACLIDGVFERQQEQSQIPQASLVQYGSTTAPVYEAQTVIPGHASQATTFPQAFYTVTPHNSTTSIQTPVVLLSLSSTAWHRRLGHPGEDVLRRLESNNLISFHKSKSSALCHACQLGKHVKLPFYSYESSVESAFEIIHSDIWTSPIPSESGIKYYAIFLDHFSHFVWVYTLHRKSDLFDNFVAFRAYVNKQFNADIKALQCDHRGEYDNTRFHDFFRQNGIQFRFSFPRTSQQNGKSELSCDWPIHQLDVKNAFLHGHLSETVYMHQPSGGSSLHGEFAMTDIGSLNYFLGISAQWFASNLFLSQSKFAEEILERARMQNCNPCRTPVDTESKLGSDGDPVCLYMHDPRDPHFTALKRILRYVRGTLDYGLQLYVSSTTQLSAYTDAIGLVALLPVGSHPAEYRGVANVVAETAWIHNLLCELHAPLFSATLVYCDNVSVVYMSANPVQHQRTKHIEIDIYFVRDFVALGQVRVLHVPSRFQYADIFTKGLPTALFIEFRSSLNVRRSLAHTEGE